MEVYVIKALATNPKNPSASPTNGYLADNTCLVDDKDQFIVKVTANVSVKVGTVIFVSQRRATDIRDKVDSLFKKYEDQTSIICTFSVEKVDISMDDFQAHTDKGYLFNPGKR